MLETVNNFGASNHVFLLIHCSFLWDLMSAAILNLGHHNLADGMVDQLMQPLFQVWIPFMSDFGPFVSIPLYGPEWSLDVQTSLPTEKGG